MADRREPTAAEIKALRGAFEEHCAAPPFNWTDFRRTTGEGYVVGVVQVAWNWCRLGYAAGINASGVDSPDGSKA